LNYFVFESALMHFEQASTFLFESKRTHWRLGRCVLLPAGLNLPRNLLSRPAAAGFLLQKKQVFIYPIFEKTFKFSRKQGRPELILVQRIKNYKDD